jgi:DNA-binding winged helix-turn-helix (wHTH) protein
MQPFRFGPFSLAPDERVVWRAGKPVALAPKALDVLVVLLANPERFVTKRELMETVWPKSSVEANVTQAMYLLRRFFREQECPIAVENVLKRGYRLVLPADPFWDEAALEPAPERIVYRLLVRPTWYGATKNRSGD